MPVDIFAPDQGEVQDPPIVVFAHGFKGFKDFGAWNLLAPRFVEAGMSFIKFNFSHNGGTVEQPIDFPDLEAFGRNNYSKELDDLGTVLDAVEDGSMMGGLAGDPKKLYLIGHSRGGGIAVLRTASDERVRKLATWASVSDFHQRIPADDIETWKEEGVTYIPNARTGQEMPIYYQFYEDLMENKERLSIPKAAPKIEVPWLICHGTADPTVDLKEAKDLASWNPKAETFFVEGADHTFNQKHPWEKEGLPTELEKVLEATIRHFRGN
jgi:pimeloyl-ACP methyl ester carboxylesterase